MDELGVDRERVIKVFNKSDLVPADAPRDGALWVSAVTGEKGFRLFKAEVARRIGVGGTSWPEGAADASSAVDLSDRPADPVV